MKLNLKKSSIEYVKSNKSKIFNELNCFISAGTAYKAGGKYVESFYKPKLNEAKKIIKELMNTPPQLFCDNSKYLNVISKAEKFLKED